MKKALQAFLVVGLIVLGAANLLPAVTNNGETLFLYGAIYTQSISYFSSLLVTLGGGTLAYFIILPFVGALSMSKNKIAATVGHSLGLGVTAFNFYALMVIKENYLDKATLPNQNYVLGAGSVLTIIASIIVMGVIVIKIIYEAISEKAGATI